MRELVLRTRHEQRGASFRDEAGAVTVASYGEAGAEAGLARSAAVLADRSHRPSLAITGPDRVAFVHGLSSNDVRGLAPGAGQHTTFLTGKGKMRGDAVLYRRSDEILLLGEAAAMAGIRAHLEGFHILEEVGIEDRSATHVRLEAHGPGARERLSGALGLAIPADLAEHAEVHGEHAGAEVVVAAEPWTGAPGYAIIAPVAAAGSLFDALVPSFALVGELALEILRVEQGVPRFGVDMDENTIPIEAGLAHAISYSKGCYTGNEVILRIKTYGHVNRVLVQLQLAGTEPPPRGAAVLAAGKEVGAISSAVFSPLFKCPVALAMLRREAAGAGSRVIVVAGGNEREAEVVVHPPGRSH